MLGGDRGDLPYGLQGADLVVRPHHRDQRGSRVDGVGEGGQIDPTSRVDRNIADLCRRRLAEPGH